MEWALFVAVVLGAAAYVVLPRRADETPRDLDAEIAELHAERASILDALRDLDDDAAAGRIVADDRLAGRHALGPALRAVTERLHAHDEVVR